MNRREEKKTVTEVTREKTEKRGGEKEGRGEEENSEREM